MEQKKWNDCVVGDKLPEYELKATTQRLVKFAGASGDFHPLHYDWSYAAKKGYQSPMVHGQLSRAWMAMLICNWIGNPALIKKLNCRFVSSVFSVGMASMMEAAEDKVTCIASGEVVNITEEGTQKYMECSLWVRTPEGANVLTGSAKILIPQGQAV